MVIYDSQLGSESVHRARLWRDWLWGTKVHEPYSSTRSMGSRTEVVACWPARLRCQSFG